MSVAENNKIMRRRLANAYLSSIISISLVLLLVGMASMLLVNAKSISDYFKENMQISVMMKQNVSEDKALAFKTSLDKERYIKSTVFVSKEQGKREMADLLGEDFLDVFETSPIPVSIDVTLNADYVSADSLEVVRTEIAQSPLVDEVVYQRSLVDALNANLSRISLVLGVFIALLLFISYVLINNTVRLNVFARRFTIHTMKLVGASWGFIRRPFLVRNLWLGILAAIMADALLVGMAYMLVKYEPELIDIITPETLLMVLGAVFVFGVIITWVCAYISINKYLRMKASTLYYI